MKTNNIYLGDAYKLIKEIPDKSIDCIYTDIPYLIQKGGHSDTPLSLRSYKLRNDDLKDIKDGIDYSIFDEFDRVLKKINIFIWCNKMQMLDILNYWTKKRKRINYEILVWLKTNPTPLCNNVWLPDIEYCLYFRESGVRLNDGYQVKHKWYMSSINKKDKDKFKHPTIKPLEMVKQHLLHTTQENSIVLDPFIGSGTTAVAYKLTNRQFIGFETNKEYWNTAINRINDIDNEQDISLFKTEFQTLQPMNLFKE